MRRKKTPIETHLDKRDVEICLRLKAAREALGLTQEACAAVIGIPKARLANYELCRAALKADAGFSFCRQCVVSERWLATGKGNTRGLLFLEDRAEAKQIVLGSSFSEAYFGFLSDVAEDVAHQLGENFFSAEAMLSSPHLTFIFAKHATELLLMKWIDMVPAERRLYLFLDMIGGGMRRLEWLERMGVSLPPKAQWGVDDPDRILTEKDPEQIAWSRKYAERFKPGGKTDLTSNFDYPTADYVKIPEGIWPKMLAQLRKLLSQSGKKTQFARDLGVTRQTVHRWLNVEEAEPSGDLALRIQRWIQLEEKAK